tara:strand:+ start:573 stop:1409 length:837 start_codon:yes stop_codon:yes gene_type:complete
MVIKSYSKINLTLKVNSKLSNNLHEIQSLYCLISLFDKIEINKTKKNKDKINFKGPFKELVNLKKNTVLNLLKKLRNLNLISNYYSITITKNIPVFGGLGGGSSNAAFILKFLLKDKINNDLLNKLRSIIGTDFKLFFKKQAFLKNLKTIINLKKNQKLYFLLIQPKIRCSTKEIYSKVRKFSKKERFNNNIANSRKSFFSYVSKSRNDLQFIVERKHPHIKKILTNIKNEKGCFLSRMTGSGSVCYGLFNDQIIAKKAYINLKKQYPQLWSSLARTV